MEVVGLDELIQVHAKQFKRDEQMSSKDFVVDDSNNVIVVVLVSIFEVLQNFEFHSCLVLKPFFVSNNLDRGIDPAVDYSYPHALTGSHRFLR